MPKFDPLFGRVSFEKAAKFIAVFDLVICCLFILSHLLGGGYVYEEDSEEYEKEVSQSMKPIDEEISYTNLPAPQNPKGGDKPSFVIAYEDYRKLTQNGPPPINVVVILVICFGVFALAHICLEVWMCRLLLKAANHKDGSALKIWFWCRLGVTILFTLYSIAGVSSIKSDILDWIFLGSNIYRMYAMYVIYEFKSHISTCNSVAKPIEM